MSSEIDIERELDETLEIEPARIGEFRRDGFVILRGVFSPALLRRLEAEISRLVGEGDRLREVPIAERSTYDQAFIQVMNLWTRSAAAKRFAFSRRLAHLATRLLGVRGVRLWHDQALYKEPGGGVTPWHVDQQYWPMSSSKSITAWIPLQDTPLEMGPVSFGRGSHRHKVARDLEIGDESETLIRDEVRRRGIEEVSVPFRLGDVSFHSGWTLHRAPHNGTDRMRCVHTVIYMDKKMRLAPPANANQRRDWETWTPSTNVGEVMDDPLNPVLYEEQ